MVDLRFTLFPCVNCPGSSNIYTTLGYIGMYTSIIKIVNYLHNSTSSIMIKIILVSLILS